LIQKILNIKGQYPVRSAMFVNQTSGETHIRQLDLSEMAAPMMYPAVKATALTKPSRPMYLLRSLRGTISAMMMDTTESLPAAPRPCT
jgi:hypothetical protein